MSNIGLDFGPDDDGGLPPDVGSQAHPVAAQAHEDIPLPRAGSRRAARSTGGRIRGCVPMLLVLVVIIAGLWFGGGWAVDKVRSLVGDNPDYSGTGTAVVDPKGKNTVTVEVHKGDPAAAIGRTLLGAGVVQSVGAFVDAAAADDRSRGIQVGYYLLNKKMKASDALAVLVEPKNLIQTVVLVPEGARVKDIAAAIVAKTDITKKQVSKALADTAALGLPASANGDPQGYLFPATYTVVPGETAASLLKQMVDKTKQVEDDLDIEAKAKDLGYTTSEIMTIASILEYEASRDQDYPKVARAIYNRLSDGMPLQSDATVAFANNLSGTIYTTAAERAFDSPYNTYKYAGLPPGPIGSPGATTIEAALNPVAGPWRYWVVVNLKTGETRFNETYAGHQQDVAVFHQYCETSDAC